MAANQIFVDGEIFLSRDEEQSRFRQALQNVLSSSRPEGSTHIFLIQGESGVGKSKLLRRLRDIAATETPYDTEVQTILADWDLEKKRVASRKSSEGSLHGRTVYYHLYRMARDAGWGHHFAEYQTALRFLNEVEGKIGDLLEHAVWDDRYAALRFLGPTGIAGLLRGRISPNEKGLHGFPNFLEDIIKEGPESIRAARSQVEGWLKSQSGLKPEEEVIFRRPGESLAKAIGVGFGKASQMKPLVLLMDSFEVITSMNGGIWTVIKSSGARIIWVIAGEGDLANSLEGQNGNPGDFDQKLTVFNLRNFHEDQVAEYMQFRAPDRLLTQVDRHAIYEITNGFPLAVQQAADLWAGGVPLEDITGAKPSNVTREAVVALMSQRLLTYCDNPNDRRAFLMMAIQRRPEENVQTAILRPQKGSFDLERHIDRLKLRYLSIRTNGSACLHDFVADSIRAYLLRHRIRVSDEVKAITTQATRAIKLIRDEFEAGFARLEDRFESEEWREMMLDHIHWLFWHNEFNAWRQFNRDFVDALGYDRQTTISLVKLLVDLRPILSRDGRDRLSVIRKGMVSREARLLTDADRESVRDYEAEVLMMAELDRWHKRYGGKDNYATERQAIIDLLQGELDFSRGMYPDAMNLYLQVEKNLPSRGEALSAHLGQAFEELGEKLAWSREGLEIVEALPSELSEKALRKALSYGHRKATVYHSMGAVQVKLGKWEPALENLLQTVTLNPANKSGWQTLGDVYFDHQQYEKAIPAFRRAVELDPRMIQIQLRLAYCYRQIDRQKEYDGHMQSLSKMIVDENEYVQACYQAVLGNVSHALGYLKIALRDGQVSKERVRKNPLLETLHNDPGFQKMIQ